MLRVQSWAPVQSKHVPERVKKWTLLKSKVIASGGPSFGPFMWINLLQGARGRFQVAADSTPATSAAGALNWEADVTGLVFLTFSGPKNGFLISAIWSIYLAAPLKTCFEACLDMLCSNFDAPVSLEACFEVCLEADLRKPKNILVSTPAPMPWSAPCSTASWTEMKKEKGKQKKKREKTQATRKNRERKKADLGGVESPSSASQLKWLKKATPHP